MGLLRYGDSAAFTEIYNRFWDKLFSVAVNKLDGDLELAEELVQDIFLDVWQRRKTLAITGKLSAYLATAMKYKVIDSRIKRKRAKDFLQNAALYPPIADTSTEEQLSFDELRDRLAALVKELPRKCRLVYTLSKEAGFSQKEIARRLNISEKTVESHLSRAMKLLRAGLQHIFIFFLF
ncbi:RNA polymerase sigma-70 factor [Compostibacter hankyongensis]|uniref:RNA polymerase sigma-70 factor n=1 Tax=Compostibacter hankyongensis TaxID=1007089 RepID=A0ABP8FX85_9BACT